MDWAPESKKKTQVKRFSEKNVIFEQPPKKWINDRKKLFFFFLLVLGVYIADAKNRFFAFFSALTIFNKVIISDISGQTLVLDRIIRCEISKGKTRNNNKIKQDKRIEHVSQQNVSSIPDSTYNHNTAVYKPGLFKI